MTSPIHDFSVSYFSGPLTMHNVLFPVEDITLSPVCGNENDKIITFVLYITDERYSFLSESNQNVEH